MRANEWPFDIAACVLQSRAVEFGFGRHLETVASTDIKRLLKNIVGQLLYDRSGSRAGKSFVSTLLCTYIHRTKSVVSIQPLAGAHS